MGLFYLPMSHKKDARLIWVKGQSLCTSKVKTNSLTLNKLK